ncbi:hypothetical protein GCM10028796_55720 [Ramlibacter monticola]
MVALGVLEDELMSLPGVEAVPAPMEVPLPVVPVVVSVLEGVVGAVLAVLLVVSLGGVVVDGVVLEVVDSVVVDVASSRLLQAVRDSAAIRARAAHCVIGDLIIRKLLEGLYRERVDSVPAACGSL